MEGFPSPVDFVSRVHVRKGPQTTDEVNAHFPVEGSDLYDQFIQTGTIRGFCLE